MGEKISLLKVFKNGKYIFGSQFFFTPRGGSGAGVNVFIFFFKASLTFSFLEGFP